ncbi:MAG: heavy-metal-associated domain-containing protein [Candidatus Thorarchaeota archaeon]
MKLKIEYEVENIHCKKCAEKIELALKYTAGIETSEVDLEGKQVKVEIDPFQITSLKIKMMLIALGFSAMIV